MRRADLIAFEQFVAETYRREASNRRGRNPALAAQLDAWREASMRRIEAMKCGPLFASDEADARDREAAKNPSRRAA